MAQTIIKHSSNQIKISTPIVKEEIISIEHLEKENESIDKKITELEEEKQKNLDLIETAESLGVSKLNI